MSRRALLVCWTSAAKAVEQQRVVDQVFRARRPAHRRPWLLGRPGGRKSWACFGELDLAASPWGGHKRVSRVATEGWASEVAAARSRSLSWPLLRCAFWSAHILPVAWRRLWTCHQRFRASGRGGAAACWQLRSARHVYQTQVLPNPCTWREVDNYA